MQDEKSRTKTRVNFNFEKIFNNQNILNLIESLGIAEATYIQAKFLPEILTGKSHIIKGDSLSGKTLACGLLLAFQKETKDSFNALIVADANVTDRIKEEFSKLNLFKKSEKFKLTVLTIDEFKESNSNEILNNLNMIIFDSIEENDENLNVIKETFAKAKENNEKIQLLLCNREISSELEKIFKDITFSSTKGKRNKEEVLDTTHYFCMLGAELTAKPNTLCDIIEAEGRPSTIIFCNQPSDTDMVEAILHKNGIRTSKLVGNAYHSRVMNALRSLENGDITAIIATDIGAKQINVRNVELVINYSSPASNEIYTSRMGQTNQGGYLKKVITFVNPLDLSNFHQIRKGLEFDVLELDIPSVEDVCKARFNNFTNTINQCNELTDNDKLEHYYTLLNESEDKENILKYMLYSNFIKIPESARRERRERFDRRNFEESDSRKEILHNESDSHSFQRSEPQVKDIRFYIGYGENDNFGEKNLIEILSEKAPDFSDKIKRFSNRKIYSFVDFSEDDATVVEDSLKDALFKDKPLCFKRATSINVPKKDDNNETDDNADNKEENNNQENFEEENNHTEE